MNMVLTLWAPEAARVQGLTVSVLALPGFSLLSLAAVADPLRAAGARVRILSPDGRAVRSACGLEVQVQGHAGQMAQAELVVILGGTDPLAPRLCEDLRFVAALGLRMVATGPAVGLLAEAGLLEGRRFSAPDPLPGLTPEPAPFTFDDQLATCPDGPVAGEVILHLMRELLGADALAAVLQTCALPPPRRAEDLPRPPSGPPALQKALRMMDARLDRPDLLAEIEEATGLSRRQLERLFAAHIGDSPARHLVTLRLKRARQLLAQTHLTVAEIASRSGFSTAAHFCRLYRRQYGVSPHA